MDNHPIGVFDSGLGGLTVVRHLMNIMPEEDIVYFGDTGRVPYGTRSEETICRYAREDSSFLLSQDVKAVIAACGTVSSVAGKELSRLPVPTGGILEPTADTAAKATRSGKIGVIGTAATVRSRSFERCLKKIDNAFQIVAVACPMLVPLVENGWINPSDEVAIAMVRRYLRPIRESGVDTLILGCTHFPLLAPIIRNELGASVELIDSGKETAAYFAEKLTESNSLAKKRKGKCRFYVSDRPDDFVRVAEIFLGCSVKGQVNTVLPDELTQRGKQL